MDTHADDFIEQGPGLVQPIVRRSVGGREGPTALFAAETSSSALRGDVEGMSDYVASVGLSNQRATGVGTATSGTLALRHTRVIPEKVEEIQARSRVTVLLETVNNTSLKKHLFLTGDLGQRIFQQPFSWKALGVDIRGRSHTLPINYRTSHQIRSQTDRLLSPALSDVDGITQDRRGTVSVFNGPMPAVEIVGTPDEETRTVGQWIKSRLDEDLRAHEIGVFVRSAAQYPRAHNAIQSAGAQLVELGENVETTRNHVSVSTMHRAKGLEFRAVAVMACDDEILPLQERIQTVADDSDLEEVYNTERHLLYVACTRARDHLLVTEVDPASEFLDDLRG